MSKVSSEFKYFTDPVDSCEQTYYIGKTLYVTKLQNHTPCLAFYLGFILYV